MPSTESGETEPAWPLRPSRYFCGVLHVTELRKAYDRVLALDGLSLHVAKGEAYALLGPNGAGKSTAIHALSGLLTPDSGEVRIDGEVLRPKARSGANRALKRKIGVVPQEIALYEDLSARQNLHFWGSLYGLGGQTLHQRTERLLERTGLSGRADDSIEHFSGGMKRRINIAAAVLHEPQLLFLDEPTVGIDPQSRNHIHDLIRELHAEGMSILYTTHYMEEAEKLCQRIGILDRGKLIAEGNLAELRQHVDQRGSIVVETRGLNGPALEALRAAFGERLSHEADTLRLVPETMHHDIAQLVEHCGNLGVELARVDIQEADLEAVFLELTGRALRD
jgi:ABC-2 type transport system ATP-binding protein